MDRSSLIRAALAVIAVVSLASAAAMLSTTAPTASTPGQSGPGKPATPIPPSADEDNESDVPDWLFFDFVDENLSGSAPPPNGRSGGDGGTKEARDPLLPTQSPALLALFALLLLIGVVVVLFRALRGGSTAPAQEPDDSTDVAAIGRTAGEAADRIDTNADVTNEIYRTWRKMTRHLSLSNPQTSTPGEFAAAAVAAGMARNDVAELTDLFETVRYGGRSPTEEREQRALAALRRIESTYAEGEANMDANTGTETVEDTDADTTEKDTNTEEETP